MARVSVMIRVRAAVPVDAGQDRPHQPGAARADHRGAGDPRVRRDRPRASGSRANADLTATALRVNRIFALAMPAIWWSSTSPASRCSGSAVTSSTGADADRQPDCVPHLHPADPDVGVDGGDDGRSWCRAPRPAPSASTRCSTPSRRSPTRPTVRPRRATGRVEFHDVSFAYPGSERPVLLDLSFPSSPARPRPSSAAPAAARRPW